MARTGVAIWGGADHLDRLLDSADEATLQQYWIPKLNWPSRLILLAITGRSAPKTKEAARAHWHWMGETARDRLMTAIKHHSPSANPEDVFRAIGFALAKEHVWSIADDTANTRGTVSGLLSDTQIAENHHRVLKAFGLPEKAFGGTPFRILPDAFELWLSADLYHHDGDK